MFTVCFVSCVYYLLYHDTVDAHVFVAPRVVEQVHPAESETRHQEAEVLVLPAQIQHGWNQEERTLHKTTKRRENTVSLDSFMIVAKCMYVVL